MSTLETRYIEDHDDKSKGQWTEFKEGELDEMFAEILSNVETAPEYGFETIRDRSYYEKKYEGMFPEAIDILVEGDYLNQQHKKLIEERSDLPPIFDYEPDEDMKEKMLPKVEEPNVTQFLPMEQID